MPRASLRGVRARGRGRAASTRDRRRAASSRRRGPLPESGTLRNRRSTELTATHRHQVARSAVPERMWCSLCETEAPLGALCHSTHAQFVIQHAVHEAAFDLRHKQNAMVEEMLRAHETLQMMRLWARAAEHRQDLDSLQAQTACVVRLKQQLEEFGAEARRCRVEASDAERRQANAIFDIDETLDLKTECEQDVHTQELENFVVDPGLDEAKQLDNVICYKRPDWCVRLLKRVAPRVERLHVVEAMKEHLEVLRTMPALRYLHVHVAAAEVDAPDLPVQLEELMVENVSTRQFQSVLRMQQLRKLALDWADDPVDVETPPLPAHHRGLQWLWAGVRPCSTVLSLAKAHAATLLELRIMCATHGDTPWNFRALAAGLRGCALVALRRIVLVRRLREEEEVDEVPHGRRWCQRQKKAIKAELLASGVRPKIFCEECDKDKVPPFPGLGDFTWMDS